MFWQSLVLPQGPTQAHLIHCLRDRGWRLLLPLKELEPRLPVSLKKRTQLEVMSCDFEIAALYQRLLQLDRIVLRMVWFPRVRVSCEGQGDENTGDLDDARESEGPGEEHGGGGQQGKEWYIFTDTKGDNIPSWYWR